MTFSNWGATALATARSSDPGTDDDGMRRSPDGRGVGGAISGRPRRRANAGHSEWNSLRKNFRDRILSCIGSVAGRHERMRGAMVRERLHDVPLLRV
jgi:hypothetical protein